jgi:hypothetical protein
MRKNRNPLILEDGTGAVSNVKRFVREGCREKRVGFSGKLPTAVFQSSCKAACFDQLTKGVAKCCTQLKARPTR